METIPLTPKVQEEITKLSQKSQNHPITSNDLEKFALLVIQDYDTRFKQKSETSSPSKAQKIIEKDDRLLNKPSEKLPKDKHLKITEIKEAIYKRFNVKDTDELKKSEQFKMATDGMDKLDFSQKQTWEMLYRKWIDILPDETNEDGYGCINRIDIFKYFRPWQVFNLDSKTATQDDIKTAFRQLSKIYHPDNQETGDRKIFERLTQMYNSLIAAIPKKS
ncbi:DnaJ domain-containing protein [Planktothrix sp. FACHB-1365]|uniref:DnaJ domain-containing protein n=1 Tax=Planktothrix sp. FACHB-1365 TaxID=2692855 RepID=UPI001682B67E|nr:DnaJ domain-containing protein [Planktothrix sp. FACHB-1365]MBD2483879.1 DnaJ domain-containing protein [Planktothrix sp. FACHB-1365]